MAYPRMADDFKGFSPNSRLLVGEMPAPSQLKTSWWQGTGVSIAAHVVILGALLYAATHVRQIVDTVNKSTEDIKYIFLEQPKPGPGVIPHTATTFSESGEPLNQPLAPQYTSTKKDEDKEEEDDTDAGHKKATHAAGHTHHAVNPSKKK